MNVMVGEITDKEIMEMKLIQQFRICILFRHSFGMNRSCTGVSEVN